MSQEKELDIHDYLPIELGWVKALSIVLPIASYFVGCLWYSVWYHGDLSGQGWQLVLTTVLVIGAGHRTGLGPKAWKFLCRYWRLNILGQVANIYLDDQNNLKIDIHRKLKDFHAPEGELLWRLPLGGWHRRKPKLFTYVTLRNGHLICEWKVVNWHISLKWGPWEINSLDTSAVRISDCRGNSLTAELGEALRYIKVNSNSDFNCWFKELPTARAELKSSHEEVMALGILGESTLKRLRGCKRFASSEGGVEIVKNFEEGLWKHWRAYQQMHPKTPPSKTISA